MQCLRICGSLFPCPRIIKAWVLDRARSTRKSQATCCLPRCSKWRSVFKTSIWQSRDKTPKYFGNLRAAYFYCCTVHFDDSITFIHQLMHLYMYIYIINH
jgi:hypothetical protein